MSEQIVSVAKEWLGTPYHHQASLKGRGCDCLGLVRGVYAEICGHVTETPPPYSRDWAEARGEETLIAAAARHMIHIPVVDATAGDVVIFRMRPAMMAKHAAILTGPDRMIHAIEGAPVSEVHMGPWWRKRIAAAFRFPALMQG